MFVFGFVWLVKEVCNIVGNGSFAEADPMSIVFIVFLGYFCFMAAYAAPSKVAFMEDGTVEIIFFRRDVITISSEKFNIVGKKSSGGEWSGWLRASCRMMYFSSETFLKLEKIWWKSDDD